MRINWKYLTMSIVTPSILLILVFFMEDSTKLKELTIENTRLKSEIEVFEHAILEHSMSMLKLGEMSGEMRDFKKIQEHLDAVIYLETVLIEHYEEIDIARKGLNEEELIIGSAKKIK